MEANMKRLRYLIAAVLLALVVVGTASATGQLFVANLSGAEEVPPRETIASGQALFSLSRDGKTLHFKIGAMNIANITQAHIHVGPRGANGPVVLWLYPDAPPATLIPGPFNGVLNRGAATAADLVGPFAGQPLSALIEALENGNAYVNVHTSQFPPGEIRGQVESAD
jgi:hypothetical protein